MLLTTKPIGDFVDAHPTIKILVLPFLILIGVTLIAGGFVVHVPKDYIYLAMAFSARIEAKYLPAQPVGRTSQVAQSYIEIDRKFVAPKKPPVTATSPLQDSLTT